MKTTITIHATTNSIWSKLRAALGREPTNEEANRSTRPLIPTFLRSSDPMTDFNKAESGAQIWPEEMGTMQAARYTGYHFTWISRAAKKGLLGRLHVGRYVFTRAELDAFKAAYRKPGPRTTEVS